MIIMTQKGPGWRIFCKKKKKSEWTISREKWQRKQEERGDKTGESNDSLEIPGRRRVTSDIPSLLLGRALMGVFL